MSEETYCDPPGSPCVFVCERCFYFLEKWIELDRLPGRRCGFPKDPELLSFAGELYEIVNVESEES